MAIIRNVLVVFCSALIIVFITACKKEGPAERAGRNIDESLEKAGKKIDESARKAGDKIEDAGNKVKDSTK
jgi:hypothetical protein